MYTFYVNITYTESDLKVRIVLIIELFALSSVLLFDL